MELLILAHAPARSLEQGFLPAAAELRLAVTILTDRAIEHVAHVQDGAHGADCELAECDVFNPLAVCRWIAAHGKRYAGVLAADTALRASAAGVAAALGLAGPAWPAAVRAEQRLDLQPGATPLRRIVDCAEPPADIDPAWFPATVQQLDDATATGTIVHDATALRELLATLRHGHTLVESYRADEEVYGLDLLATPEGTAVLCGSRIAFDAADADAVRTKRVAAFLPRPPNCDELLALLPALALGNGRHHIEYGVSAAGLRIRDIHDGLHDDESELALDDQLDGNLFAATIKAALGQSVKAPQLLPLQHTGTPALEAAA
ncbi:hypothetical protein IP92_01571 [Pseudoduganella flava]|uniref:ATP-grasp domain-containing protein n=1 Tax=Pseudoduganella flava TaxID=871742 RepID=A0A562Q0X7_9BURK|nr:hypothetical protein [Pseudoduganella flava]QGZ38140.1 hypothetical protein GO485_03135 [Pseudoduganella flava]TWI50342.1 hypothetical protein IP92_01571 [Pseudoduganella flava]